jgi:hypothetical protein
VRRHAADDTAAIDTKKLGESRAKLGENGAESQLSVTVDAATRGRRCKMMLRQMCDADCLLKRSSRFVPRLRRVAAVIIAVAAAAAVVAAAAAR